MSDNKIKVISVAGPTASGKTALSVTLAKLFSGEIVSADSMQIYRGMDIATAKPTFEERAGIPHHLMDYVDIGEVYSVARYVQDAKAAIDDILLRNKLPIIAGGTGLYIDSLLSGIEFCDGDVDYELRSRLQQRLDNEGLDVLLLELSGIDPQSAAKLAKERNPKRIIRALEIYYTTGVTMTEQNIRSRESGSIYSPVKIALNYRDRQKLYDRINLRVDMMLEQGLLKEAEYFFSLSQGDTSRQAIGYKELRPYFCSEKSLDECIDTLKQSTRRYAKRQLTWFMRDPEIKWFYKDDYSNDEELTSVVCGYLIDKGFVINE